MERKKESLINFFNDILEECSKDKKDSFYRGYLLGIQVAYSYILEEDENYKYMSQKLKELYDEI